MDWGPVLKSARIDFTAVPTPGFATLTIGAIALA